MLGGLSHKLEVLYISVTDLFNIKEAFSGTAILEDAILLACSSLVLWSECPDLAIHLDSYLQQACSGITFSKKDLATSLFSRPVENYAFIAPLDVARLGWPKLQSLHLDLRLLAQNFGVQIDFDCNPATCSVVVMHHKTHSV